MNAPTSSPSRALNVQSFAVPRELADAIDKEAAAWRERGNVRRLWQRDTSLWTGGDENKWVGWLTIIEELAKQLADYRAFAQDVRQAGFTDAVLLGMGGSSLGPEVLTEIFAPAARLSASAEFPLPPILRRFSPPKPR